MEGFLSIAIAIIGVIMYAIATNPKAMEIGRIMFFCGLLAFLLNFGQHIVGALTK